MGDCPARAQLALLLAERLRGPDAERVEAHVQSCARCQGVLGELSGGSPTEPAWQAPRHEPRPEFLRRLREASPDAEGAPGRANGAAPTVPLPTGSAAGAGAGARPAVPGYQILGELGRGGTGVVYKARQTALGRVVALKVLLAGAHAGRAERTRLKVEAEAVARLQHPNIVQVYEVGEEGGCPYLALEHVEGGSLADRLRGPPLPAGEAAQLAETLARAVHAAHERGVVHRDLKPANVLLAADGTPKITDFGLAKRLDGVTPHTQTGAVQGTPDYMAPEQAEGQAVGRATDVHALGALLYQMLTGRPPFLAESALDTLLRVRLEEPVPPSVLRPRLPRDLETVCLKCLRKEPARRYASALALAEDLRRFRDGQPVEARPTPLWERGAKWVRRRPAPAALLAVSGLAALALVGVAVGLGYSGRLQVALDDARRQAADADAQRQRAVREGAKVRRLLYLAQIAKADRFWQDGQVALMHAVLEGLRPDAPGQEDLRGFEWYYLWQLRSGSRLTLQPAGPHVAFTPDGKRVASVSGDGTLRVWDAGTGQAVLQLPRACAADACLAVSPDGKRLAAPAPDGKAVQVWDTAAGRPALRLEGHTGAVTGVAFSPDGTRMATASADTTVRLWDAATGREALTFRGHARAVSCVVFGADSRRLGSVAPEEGRPCIWDAATGREIYRPPWRSPSVTGLALSPDGTSAASGGGAGVTVWDTTPGADRRIGELTYETFGRLFLRGHAYAVTDVAFSPDSRRLASASLDGTVKVWDATAGTELFTLKGHRAGVRRVTFSPDGTRLATASEDGTVKVWDAGPVREETTLVDAHSRLLLNGHPQPFYPAFSPDGKCVGIVSASDVALWDTTTGAEVLSLPAARLAVGTLAISPDGRLAATSAGPLAPPEELSRAAVKVWDVTRGRQALSLAARGERPGEAIQLWDLASGHDNPSFVGHPSLVSGMAFSAAGDRLAVAGDGRVRVWDVRRGQEVFARGVPGRSVTRLTFSRDGKRLAGAADEAGVRVWDATSGEELRTLRTGDSECASVAFSPDGTRMAGALKNGTVAVWDAATGQQVLTLQGHAHEVWDVAFSPDGKRLASASKDRTVKVWDVQTGQEALTLRGNREVVRCLAFTADGRRLAGVAADGRVHVWDAAPGEPERPGSPAAP
jgi:WD40 repeat protein